MQRWVDAVEQVEELFALRLGQVGKGLGERVDGDRPTRVESHLPGPRQVVLDPATATLPTLDQSLCHKAIRERPEGLIALECRHRQVMRGRARIVLDGSKRIPLRQGRSDTTQTCVQHPVVARLDDLDRSAEFLDVGGHALIVPDQSRLFI